MGKDVVQRGIDNLVRLVGETGCRVIMDHHAVREPRFRERLAQVFDTGRVVTAAEYVGRRDECLEARRAALWPGAGGRRTRARRQAGPEYEPHGGEVLERGRNHVGDAEGGDHAPDIRLQGIGGKEWSLADQRGKSVVLLLRPRLDAG
jgi:hypothetical protein